MKVNGSLCDWYTKINQVRTGGILVKTIWKYQSMHGGNKHVNFVVTRKQTNKQNAKIIGTKGRDLKHVGISKRFNTYFFHFRCELVAEIFLLGPLTSAWDTSGFTSAISSGESSSVSLLKYLAWRRSLINNPRISLRQLPYTRFSLFSRSRSSCSAFATCKTKQQDLYNNLRYSHASFLIKKGYFSNFIYDTSA